MIWHKLRKSSTKYIPQVTRRKCVALYARQPSFGGLTVNMVVIFVYEMTIVRDRSGKWYVCLDRHYDGSVSLNGIYFFIAQGH